MAGEESYILKARVGAPGDLEELLARIRADANVRTRTTIVLSTPYEARPPRSEPRPARRASGRPRLPRMPSSLLRNITIDSHDPYAQATWWAAVIGGTVDASDSPDDDEVSLPSAGRRRRAGPAVHPGAGGQGGQEPDPPRPDPGHLTRRGGRPARVALGAEVVERHVDAGGQGLGTSCATPRATSSASSAATPSARRAEFSAQEQGAGYGAPTPRGSGLLAARDPVNDWPRQCLHARATRCRQASAPRAARAVPSALRSRR